MSKSSSSSTGDEGLIIPGQPGPAAPLIIPGQHGPAQPILRPGQSGAPPDILAPSKKPSESGVRKSTTILRPGLCQAAEEFITRLQERGDLIHERLGSDHFLIRRVKKIEKYDPLTPASNRGKDDGRYIGVGADLRSPAARDGLYTSEFDAADREARFYFAKDPPSLVVMSNSFRGIPPAALTDYNFHVLGLQKEVSLTNVELTLKTHRSDPVLKKIERSFRVDSLHAVSNPIDYSFARGIGRGLAKMEQGIVYQSARCFPEECGHRFRNVLVFGDSKAPMGSLLRKEGLLQFTPRGATSPGLTRLIKRS